MKKKGRSYQGSDLPSRFRSISRQWAAIGLLVLCIAIILAQDAVVAMAQQDASMWERKYHDAVSIERDAVRAYGELLQQVESEKEARAAQAAAYESLSGYRYIGECTITAYCPCEECCGQWADGLTATGLPAVPGVVAVDPEVIPMGSTVIIDGQRYLAADSGVTGLWVDIAVAEHQKAIDRGVSSAEVWVVIPEGGSD